MANEIKFFLSGGTSNTNPFLSNGGAISSTPIINGLLNNLWPDANESDTENGLTDHKVIYIKNVSASPLTGIKAYFGESDDFVGMAILPTTVKNSPVPLLAVATAAVDSFFLVWQNISEDQAGTVNLDNNRQRVALYVSNVKHPVYNQYPDQIELMLKKTGSPTGTATIKVWYGTNTATDNTVIRTIGTIDVSTLTTTLAKYTFNTVDANPDITISTIPSVGWRIGIEYITGTSGNHVDVGYTTKTAATNQGAYIQTWSSNKWTDDTLKWPAMNFSTNTGPCFQSGNPSPPGSGSPPPGECGSQSAAAGSFPVIGGGGGAVDHGYPIVAATDNGNDGNVASNVFDHDMNTRWSQKSKTAQLTLDLGSTQPVNYVKIAWLKGDERVSKFNLQYSTDNVTYTTINPTTGANFLSSGHSTDLEQVPFSTTTGFVTAGAATKRDVWFQWMFARTGDSPHGTGFMDYVNPAGSHEIIEALTNPLTSDADYKSNVRWGGWQDVDDPLGGEISDFGEFNDPQTFDDGLEVNPYYSISKKKLVSGSAGSAQKIDSQYPTQNPNIINQGSVLSPAPQIWVIFWGTNWSSGSGNTYRLNVIDAIQNKLLDSDTDFWDQAIADYKIARPKWGGSVIYTGSPPVDPSNYNQSDMVKAIFGAVNLTSITLPSPFDSIYDNNGVSHSNIHYVVCPDRSFHLQPDPEFGDNIGGFHTATVSEIDVTPPPPPPTPPPTPPPPGPGPPPPPPTPSPPPPSPDPTARNARYIRYLGLGNTDNDWNSITEFEIYGTAAPEPTPSPPPGGTPTCAGGTNESKPTSWATGLCVPDLNTNDYVAIHLERAIPQHTGHVDIDNYSIIITNDANVKPPSNEPIPQGGPGGGSLPLPVPPGEFDPGTIPIADNPPPPAPGPCPAPGGGGTTPDGITLASLPAGYSYGEHNQNPNENFKSDGSFRLDKGVQPALNQVNLVVYLNLSSGSDEISGKLSGGTHTDNAPKNGRCYDIGVNQAGDRVRIRKENPHPDYHDGPPSHDISLGSLNGKWVGYQFMKWNEGSNVHLQCWVDTTGSDTPTNQWSKILDDIDTGNWFDDPWLTVFDSSDSQTTVRVDNMSESKFHYKFFDAVRINGP